MDIDLFYGNSFTHPCKDQDLVILRGQGPFNLYLINLSEVFILVVAMP